MRVNAPMTLYTENEKTLRTELGKRFEGSQIILRARFEDVFHDVSTIVQELDGTGAVAAIVTTPLDWHIPDQVLAIVLYKHTWSTQDLRKIRTFCRTLQIRVFNVDENQQHFEKDYFSEMALDDEYGIDEGLAGRILYDHRCPHCHGPLALIEKHTARKMDVVGIAFRCLNYGKQKCAFICDLSELPQYLNCDPLELTKYMEAKLVDLLRGRFPDGAIRKLLESKNE